MRCLIFIIFIISYFETNCQIWRGVGFTRLYGGVNTLDNLYNKLYAGGGFIKEGDMILNNIAAWDSLKWDSLGLGFPQISTGVNDITDYNNKIYAGGGMLNIWGDTIDKKYLACWNGTNWLPVGNAGTPDNQVNCLQKFNDKLYLGGDFVFIGNDGNYYWHIASWNDTAWSELDGGVLCGCIIHVYAMTVYNNELIVGGAFTQAGGITAYNIAAWDGAQWHPVGGGLDGPVQALVVDTIENVLYAGGVFYNAFNTDSTIYARKLAKWDGNEWSHIGTVSDCDVHSLCMYHGDLYAGGCFTLVDSVPVNYIARWNGVKWDSLGCGVYGDVTALCVYKDELYVGGGLLTAGCDSAYGIARWYIPPDTATQIANSKELIANSKMKIYPNPAGDSFTVETSLPAGKKGISKIYNLNGELYRKFVIEPGKPVMKITTTGWQRGTYLCALEVDGKKVAGEKIVVQ